MTHPSFYRVAAHTKRYPTSTAEMTVEIIVITSLKVVNMTTESGQNTYHLQGYVESGEVPHLTAPDHPLQRYRLAGRTVTFGNSTPSVASAPASVVTASDGTFDATITALAAGSTNIWPICGGVAFPLTEVAAVAVTIPQSNADSITIVQGTGAIVLAVGQSVVRSAEVRDAQGQVLTEQTVTWYTSDGTKVSVAADSGDELHQTLVGAVAQGGTPYIYAACGSITSAQIGVTVNPASDYGNEGPGMTQYLDHSFGTLTNWSNYGVWAVASLGTDAAAPKSPSDVLNYTYPAGVGAGNFPARRWYTPDLREFYFKIWMKFRSPWTYHVSTVNKMGFICTRENEVTQNEVIWGLKGSAASNARMLLGIQTPSPQPGASANPPSVVNGFHIANLNQPSGGLCALGDWHEVEFKVVMSTGGLANGQIHGWVDGTKHTEHYDAKYATGTNDGKVDGFLLQPYWGGNPADDSKDQEDLIQYDHLYISGKPW